MKSDWFRHGTIYQIYPQSFCDGNGDGVGDLRGLISKLDYISSLGVDGIWLCPVYDSPNRDNGYDVRNYFEIQNRFGTMSDFEELTAKCRERGIRVVMDMVLNHSSDECEYFTDAKSSADNPRHDWYIWKKPGKDGAPPTNWGAIFGGSAWNYVPESDEYYLGTFSPHQPDFNWHNQALREKLFEITEWWLKKGVDGFRMDAINFISKNTDYPNGIADRSGYAAIHPFVRNGKMVHEWLGELKSKVLDKYGAMTVGEADGATVAHAIDYSRELDMIFSFDHVALDVKENFELRKDMTYLAELKAVLTEWQKGMRNKAWNALFWENHDQPRIVSRLGDTGKYREASAKMLATVLFFLQGTPFIYQGGELGSVNTEFRDKSELRDLDIINALNKYTADGAAGESKLMAFANYKGRDTGRTPMPWNDGAYAGFSETEPWIKVGERFAEINVSEQDGRADSVLNYYRKLIALRKNNDIIENGEYEIFDPENPDVYEYARILGGKGYRVVCSFRGREISYRSPLSEKTGEVVLCNYGRTAFPHTGILRPYEAVVFLLRL